MARQNDHAKIITLREAFSQAIAPTPPDGYWLYTPAQRQSRDLNTKCYFADGPEEDDDEDIVGSSIFRTTLGMDDLANCVHWADRLAERPDDNARLEIFLYYCRHDAFPETLGAPPPPPVEESQRKLDLQWYDKLGPENPKQACKREGCQRGTVQFSSFCRKHHFEMILRRPCPFDH